MIMKNELESMWKQVMKAEGKIVTVIEQTGSQEDVWRS
jgi:hypothetical protein